jgi:DNA-binding XRE family transcriptional regulator
LLLTQAEFAELLGVSRRSIIRWEADECLPILEGRKLVRKRVYKMLHRFKEYDNG